MRQALELALEALEDRTSLMKWQIARDAVKEALAQPEQDTNKNGSPCPEFWDWLPKAYNFEGNGNFTKYNMEVAFLAGKQALQPEQEPVATLDDLEQEIYENTRQFVSRDVMEWMLKRYYTTPPQPKWIGLPESAFAGMTLQQVTAMKYAEQILKDQNT